MRKQTNYKLPEEIITALQQRAVAERTTATDLVIQALSSFLGLNPEGENTHIAPSIYEITSRVEQLETRLDKLEASERNNFMYQSFSEASDIDIRIERDPALATERDEQFAAVLNQFQLLCKRLEKLEALVQEYNCPS